VGVIFKTERDSFRVLNQNGQVRLIQPHQITTRRDSTHAVATDSQDHEIRPGDNKEKVEGKVSRQSCLIVNQVSNQFIRQRSEPE
jgi:transcription elongation factor SPT5